MKALCITAQPGTSIYEGRLWLHKHFWQTVENWGEIVDRMAINWGDYHPIDLSNQAKEWVKEGLIGSSFSPYALDEFEATQVLIFVGDGFVRLIHHPDYQRWSEAMLPGEFWSHRAPEEWLELPRLTDTELLELMKEGA